MEVEGVGRGVEVGGQWSGDRVGVQGVGGCSEGD